MRMSAGVEWAVHCCIVLSQADEPVPAQRLAEFHGVSRTYLAKHLQELARAGLVTASEGRVGGYALTRPAGEITVLDVVLAIEGDESTFRCTEIRQNGPLPASPRPADGRAGWRGPCTPPSTRGDSPWPGSASPTSSAPSRRTTGSRPS